MRTEALTIRTATIGDVAAVDRLLARSYPRLLKADYPPSTMVTAVPLLARAKPGLVACGTYYVAELVGTGVVGAGGWTARGGGSGIADVRHVAVDPDAVRRGIGGRILGRILSEARAAGNIRLDCLATRTAVPFYASLGFRTLGPQKIALAPGITFEAMRMTRAL